MMYWIVNEFQCQIILNSPDAEELLPAALEDESFLTPSMEQRFEDVFSPISFYYPNGLQDHSVW